MKSKGDKCDQSWLKAIKPTVAYQEWNVTPGKVRLSFISVCVCDQENDICHAYKCCWSHPSSKIKTHYSPEAWWDIKLGRTKKWLRRALMAGGKSVSGRPITEYLMRGRFGCLGIGANAPEPTAAKGYNYSSHKARGIAIESKLSANCLQSVLQG